MRKPAIMIVLALVLGAAGVACWLWLRASRDTAPVNVAEYESEMTEALVRTLLEPLRTNNVSACFLAFGERPTAASYPFVARFSNVRPPVSDLGKAIFSPLGNILDASSGKPAALIQIVAIRERNARLFDVDVVLSGLSPSPDRGTYSVVQAYDGWSVKRRQP